MPLPERKAENRTTGNQGLHSLWWWVWEGAKEMEWIWERQFRSRQGGEEMKDELVCLFSDGNWFPEEQLRDGAGEWGWLVPQGKLSWPGLGQFCSPLDIPVLSHLQEAWGTAKGFQPLNNVLS